MLIFRLLIYVSRMAVVLTFKICWAIFALAIGILRAVILRTLNHAPRSAPPTVSWSTSAPVPPPAVQIRTARTPSPAGSGYTPFQH